MTDAAADADHIGLQSIDYINYTACDIRNIPIYDSFCGLVALTHRVKGCSARNGVNIVVYKSPHLAVVVVAHSVFCLLNKGGGGGILLPASASAAAALFAVKLNYHVSHFARGVVKTYNQLAVDDDAASDTRSEGNGDKVLNTVAGARYCLAKGCTVGVVVKIYGSAESFFQHFGSRNLIKVKIVRKLYISCFLINRTGGANAD